MTPATRTDARLARDLLAPPIAWLVQLYLSPPLAYLACQGSRWPLYILTVLAALVALWTLLDAPRARRDAPEDQPLPGFLERAVLVTGGFFLFVILATGVATLVLEACPLR